LGVFIFGFNLAVLDKYECVSKRRINFWLCGELYSWFWSQFQLDLLANSRELKTLYNVFFRFSSQYLYT